MRPRPRKLASSLATLVERHSLAEVLAALVDACNDEVERLSQRQENPEAARPWAKVACRLEELGLFAGQHGI